MTRSSDQSDTDNSDQDDIRDTLSVSPYKDSGYRYTYCRNSRNSNNIVLFIVILTVWTGRRRPTVRNFCLL